MGIYSWTFLCLKKLSLWHDRLFTCDTVQYGQKLMDFEFKKRTGWIKAKRNKPCSYKKRNADELMLYKKNGMKKKKTEKEMIM